MFPPVVRRCPSRNASCQSAIPVVGNQSLLPLFFGAIPVSYTHLDVYKRQEIKRPLLTHVSAYMGLENALSYHVVNRACSPASKISKRITPAILISVRLHKETNVFLRIRTPLLHGKKLFADKSNYRRTICQDTVNGFSMCDIQGRRVRDYRLRYHRRVEITDNITITAPTPMISQIEMRCRPNCMTRLSPGGCVNRKRGEPSRHSATG